MAQQDLWRWANRIGASALVGMMVAGCQTWQERGEYPTHEAIMRASQGDAVYQGVGGARAQAAPKHTDVRTQLLGILRARPEPELRAMAARDLRHFRGDPEVIVALVSALHNDPRSQVRRAAVASLSVLGGPKAVEGLCVALHRDGREPVRFETARALGTLHAPATVEHLRRAAFSDSSRRVRHAAMMALSNTDPTWRPASRAGPARGDFDARRGPHFWVPFPPPYGTYGWSNP